MWIILDIDREASSKVQDTDRPQSASDALTSAKDETIAVLREQLEAERAAHAESRRLLAAALERIPPQLEAPSEASKSSVTPADASDEGEYPRSWWRRMFGA